MSKKYLQAIAWFSVQGLSMLSLVFRADELIAERLHTEMFEPMEHADYVVVSGPGDGDRKRETEHVAQEESTVQPTAQLHPNEAEERAASRPSPIREHSTKSRIIPFVQIRRP